MFGYFTRNTDNLLVGRRFDASAVGFYKKAYDVFDPLSPGTRMPAIARGKTRLSKPKRCEGDRSVGEVALLTGGQDRSYVFGLVTALSQCGIHVHVVGNDPVDNQVLKFTRDGKFLMQIGRPGKSEGSNSERQLGRPAHMDTDPAASEVFIADGYGNHRVAVFDAKTGAYKRHWGAYGGIPNDDKLPPYDPTASGSESSVFITF